MVLATPRVVVSSFLLFLLVASQWRQGGEDSIEHNEDRIALGLFSLHVCDTLHWLARLHRWEKKIAGVDGRLYRQSFDALRPVYKPNAHYK